MSVAFSLEELAERIGAELHGDGKSPIRGVNTLDSAGEGEITFLANPRYRSLLRSTSASAVILTRDDLGSCPVSALVTPNPYLAYARATALLYPPGRQEPGVHATASVAPDARIDESAYVGPCAVVESGAAIGSNVVIGPGCVVGKDAVVGDGSRLVARVTLCRGVRIGRRVLVHPGAVIGSDGFGLANDEGRWVKVAQVGSVVVGDDVEIGANTTIDRGALEDTVIGEGVKLDNQIQVAHNVHIGAHTAIAACVGIAGSTRIGSHCTIGGGAGIIGHLKIADHVQITAMSFVTRSIRTAGSYSSGFPVLPSSQWHKAVAYFRRLVGMEARVRTLERRAKSGE